MSTTGCSVVPFLVGILLLTTTLVFGQTVAPREPTSRVMIQWNVNDAGSPITQSQVRRWRSPTCAGNHEEEYMVSGAATEATLAGLIRGTAYLRIRAQNAVGWGPWSACTPLSVVGTVPQESCTCSTTVGVCGNGCTREGDTITTKLTCDSGQKGNWYRNEWTCAGQGKTSLVCPPQRTGKCTEKTPAETDCKREVYTCTGNVTPGGTIVACPETITAWNAMKDSGQLEVFHGIGILLDPRWTCGGKQCTTTRGYFRTCTRPEVAGCSCGATAGSCSAGCRVVRGVSTSTAYCAEDERKGVYGVEEAWTCSSLREGDDPDNIQYEVHEEQCVIATNSSGGPCSCRCLGPASAECHFSCRSEGIRRGVQSNCPAGWSGTQYRDIGTCSSRGMQSSTCESAPTSSSCRRSTNSNPDPVPSPPSRPKEDPVTQPSNLCACGPRIGTCDNGCTRSGDVRQPPYPCPPGQSGRYRDEWTCTGQGKTDKICNPPTIRGTCTATNPVIPPGVTPPDPVTLPTPEKQQGQCECRLSKDTCSDGCGPASRGTQGSCSVPGTVEERHRWYCRDNDSEDDTIHRGSDLCPATTTCTPTNPVTLPPSPPDPDPGPVIVPPEVDLPQECNNSGRNRCTNGGTFEREHQFNTAYSCNSGLRYERTTYHWDCPDGDGCESTTDPVLAPPHSSCPSRSAPRSTCNNEVKDSCHNGTAFNEKINGVSPTPRSSGIVRTCDNTYTWDCRNTTFQTGERGCEKRVITCCDCGVGKGGCSNDCTRRGGYERKDVACPSPEETGTYQYEWVCAGQGKSDKTCLGDVQGQCSGSLKCECGSSKNSCGYGCTATSENNYQTPCEVGGRNGNKTVYTWSCVGAGRTTNDGCVNSKESCEPFVAECDCGTYADPCGEGCQSFDRRLVGDQVCVVGSPPTWRRRGEWKCKPGGSRRGGPRRVGERTCSEDNVYRGSGCTPGDVIQK